MSPEAINDHHNINTQITGVKMYICQKWMLPVDMRSLPEVFLMKRCREEWTHAKFERYMKEGHGQGNWQRL
jgi:hypothetical protein